MIAQAHRWLVLVTLAALSTTGCLLQTGDPGANESTATKRQMATGLSESRVAPGEPKPDPTPWTHNSRPDPTPWYMGDDGSKPDPTPWSDGESEGSTILGPLNASSKQDPKPDPTPWMILPRN